MPDKLAYQGIKFQLILYIEAYEWNRSPDNRRGGVCLPPWNTVKTGS